MTKPPILIVVGYSNSGKTRSVVALVSALTRRGYRVATAKHCHDGFDLDVEGKDSWKHKQAGAVATVMSGGGRVALIEDTPGGASLAEIVQRYMRHVDLVIAEGFSWEPYPKVLVVGGGKLAEAKNSTDETVFALVADLRLDSALPQFSFDDMEALASLIEEKFFAPNQT